MAATKVALVTASSAGLGAACVKALARDFRVVVNYYSRPEKAESVIKEAESIPANYQAAEQQQQPRFTAIQADMSQRSEITRLVDETISAMGRLDVVVSNHGWTRLTNFFDLPDQLIEDDWDRCFNLNVKSHLWLLAAAKPHLSASPGGGSFITVASVAGVRPGGSSLPYGVTKAAQIHMVKGLATICGPAVRVNSVSPGLMMTEWGARFPEAKVRATVEKSAGKALATPEDVAEQICTLALGRSITGQNLVMDCGIAI